LFVVLEHPDGSADELHTPVCIVVLYTTISMTYTDVIVQLIANRHQSFLRDGRGVSSALIVAESSDNLSVLR